MPLAEQRKIAAILGTWDAAIAKAEQLVTALKARKRALMQRLLTGEARFPGFVGEWRTTKLGDVATVKRGASPRPIHDLKYFADEGRAWVRIIDVTEEPTRYLKSASQYLSRLGESKSVKVEPGELIMSICATIGVPKIVQIPACIHDGFVLLKDYESSLQRDFLYHYIGFITDQLAHSGQPGTQRNLNTSIVQNMIVPLISIKEQSRIVAVLNACEDEIMCLERQIVSQSQQKRALMQRLLTGEVRAAVDAGDDLPLES
jgi:type I restriction enzyme, S subunit